MNTSPLRLRTRQECPPSSLLVNTVLEAGASAIREKQVGREEGVGSSIQIGKEELKLPLFTHDHLCRKSNRIHKEATRLINELRRVENSR